MTWTTSKPRQPGPYWYQPAEEGVPLILQVDHELVVAQGAWHVSELEGYWAGPLAPPRTSHARERVMIHPIDTWEDAGCRGRLAARLTQRQGLEEDLLSLLLVLAVSMGLWWGLR